MFQFVIVCTCNTLVLYIDNNYKQSAMIKDKEIHINCAYIAYLQEREIRGLLYKETSRVWLWDKGRKAPMGLLEGMAQYITLDT